MMARILVWDLPTRAFHWFLTAALVGAMGIALIVDDDSPLFQTHMLFGLIAAMLVVLRVVWGVVGTKYARFGSFLFGPRTLLGYLRGVVHHPDERYPGHNPGSAYAIYAMLLLSLGLATSGVLLPTWKPLEEAHGLMAFLMILTVAVHLAGLVWHTIRHRENIALSMIDGRKVGDASQAIASSRPLVAVLFLALAAGGVFLVFEGHDAGSSQVTMFGRTIRLGESEQENAKANAHDGEHGKSHHGDRHRKRGDRHEDRDD